MKIYQFYESKDGSHPSSIDDLKHKAEQAGWQHELYDLKRLLDELTDNDLREAIKRMWRFLPFTMAASATSDFFRYWALLVDNRSLYCDDDVYCTTDSFPSLPTDDGVWTGSEQSKITNLNTCTTLVNGVKGMLYARLMTSLAADKLKRCWLGSYEDCKSAARIIIDNKWSLIGFLGPAWVRYYVPMLIQQGIPVYRLPYELASSHDRTSALWHRGSGTWCYGGNGNPNAQRL